MAYYIISVLEYFRVHRNKKLKNKFILLQIVLRFVCSFFIIYIPHDLSQDSSFLLEMLRSISMK